MVQNDLWERVGRNRFVVLYDQRGTGASKRLQTGAPQSMDAQVADLDAVRQALGLTKVALLGDSYGGLVAMAYAAAHPEHVAKLILSDSPGPSWHDIVHVLPDVFPDIEEENKQEAQKLGPETEAAARAGLRNHFRMIFYSPEKRDAYMSKMGDLGFEPAVGDAVEKATADLNLTSKLADFKFPTLVINGRYDMNVAPLTAWRLAHAIPGAKVVFFEQSGHLPAYEEPEKYIEVLEGFLNGK
jgi:proline iminopeptidase